MPLSFSVITCTWNSMPHLEESIGSVLMQECAEVEYVFVDRGSTDDTLEQIRALRRPTRILQNVRGGIGHAMNLGLEAATGDIIVFLHADEYFIGPEVLATVARRLHESRSGWLYGRAMRDFDGHLAPTCCKLPPYSHERLLQGNFIHRPAAFVRRNLLQRIGGFDTNLRHAMDYDLWLKLACLSEPCRLDLPLAAVHDDEGSLYADRRLAEIEESFVVRLAHEGKHPLARALHYTRHFIRRQRAMQLGAGR